MTLPHRSEATQGSWSIDPGLPGPRASAASAYDPVRNQMILYGGRIVDPEAGSTWSARDLWTLALDGSNQWHYLGERGAAVSNATIVYDDGGDRFLIYGGVSPNDDNNITTSLSLSNGVTWQTLATTGITPPTRYNHGAIFDSAFHRMLIFGGNSVFDPENASVYALDVSSGAAWSVLATTGTPPPVLYDPAGVYDPVRQRMLIYDGGNTVHCLALSGPAVWSTLTVAGVPPTPAPGPGTRFLYDGAHDRFLILDTPQNKTYVLTPGAGSTATWSTVVIAGALPEGRSEPAVILRAGGDSALMFGGLLPQGGTPVHFAMFDETLFQLTLTGTPAWTTVTPGGNIPPRISGHRAIYDPVDRRMYVLWGGDGYYFDLAGPGGWTHMQPTGPVWDGGGALAFDYTRRRAVGFGSQGFASLLSLSLGPPSTWAAQATVGTPPPSGTTDYSLIYDAQSDRLIVYGGSQTLSDVWSLTLTAPPTWTQLSPGGPAPMGRYAHAACYIPARHEMVMTGGYAYINSMPTTLSDTWVLSLGATPTWSLVLDDPDGLGTRGYQAAVYDPQRDRMMVMGGSYVGFESYCYGVRYDIELEFGPNPAWKILPSESVNASQSAIYDIGNDQVVTFGGVYGCWRGFYTEPVTFSRRTGFLKLGGTSSVSPTPPMRESLRLQAARPNPMRSLTTIAFQLESPAAVQLEIFDLAGRRQRHLIDGDVRVGVQSVQWDGRNDAGQALPAGVYFYTLRGPGWRESNRILLVR